LRTRKWTNQQGQDQYTTEIQAREMQMLDSRGEASNQEPQQAQQQAGGFDDFNDDIPF
jgi:single-strand DNA-binding protein